MEVYASLDVSGAVHLKGRTDEKKLLADATPYNKDLNLKSADVGIKAASCCSRVL
jgi:hypothetical protein